MPRRDTANLRRLVAVFAPFHPRPREFPAELPFMSGEGTLTLHSDIGEIDLLAEVLGIGSFDEVRSLSITVEALDHRFVTLGLPGLIQAKRASVRAKDLAAVPELESLLEACDTYLD